MKKFGIFLMFLFLVGNVFSSDINEDLLTAAKNGDLAKVETLINVGANVNYTNRNGNTALMLAAEKVYLAIVEALIKGGANVNNADNDGRTALIWAAIRDRLREYKLRIVQALISKGANVNRVSNDGRTALIWAAMKDNLEMFQALIDAGADVSQVSNNGETALIWAAENNNLGMVQALIGKGADVSQVRNRRETALILAAERKNLRIVQALIKANAKINYEFLDYIKNIPELLSLHIAKPEFPVYEGIELHEEEVEQKADELIEKFENELQFYAVMKFLQAYAISKAQGNNQQLIDFILDLDPVMLLYLVVRFDSRITFFYIIKELISSLDIDLKKAYNIRDKAQLEDQIYRLSSLTASLQEYGESRPS